LSGYPSADAGRYGADKGATEPAYAPPLAQQWSQAERHHTGRAATATQRPQAATAPQSHATQPGQWRDDRHSGAQHHHQPAATGSYWSQPPQAPAENVEPTGFGHQPAYAQRGYVQPDAQHQNHHQHYGSYAPYPQAHDPYAGYAEPTGQGQNGYHDPRYDAQGYDRIDTLSEHQPGGRPHTEAGYDQQDAYDDYDEEPPKQRRGLLVFGALLGAIAIGGGLAFVYKTFGASGGKRGGPTPVIAGPAQPTKVAAASDAAAGKTFEGNGKKIMARVGDAAPPPPASATTGSTAAVPGLIVSPPPQMSTPAPPPPSASQPQSQSDGQPSTRRVPTVQIGPDGAPVASREPVLPPRSREPQVNVPGLAIDNRLSNAAPSRVAAAPAPATDAEPAAEAPVPAPPVRQARVAARPPVEAPPAAPVRTATPAASAAPGESGGSGGYVAVLSSQKDAMSALRVFASLQQKYPQQLDGRQPEVKEANLGDKGIWQRLVVGPAGSRESVAKLCASLKAAGHKDCWPARY
jgi:hypothetical protein